MKQWFKRLRSGAEDLIIGFICTVCAYALLLGFFKMLWALYCETQVAQKFQDGSPGLFAAINDIICGNVLMVALANSAHALKICLAVALGCQLLMIKRFLYDSRGQLGKLLWFGIPCTVAVTWYSGAVNQEVWFAFYFLPTVNLMGYCFKFIASVVPARA